MQCARLLVCISPYLDSVQTCENRDQKNSKYGHFLRSDKHAKTAKAYLKLKREGTGSVMKYSHHGRDDSISVERISSTSG